MGHTPLQRQLLGQPAPPGPAAALVLATRQFARGERVEMGLLADELGVSRATLFRWVGGRDELLGEVIWSLAQNALRQAQAAAADRTGADRVATIMASFAGSAVRAPFFTAFVAREPERALRILTTRAGTFQGRLVSAVESLLAAEGLPLGEPTSPDPSSSDSTLSRRDLAYLIVRIEQGLIYADVISGQVPDPARIHQAIALLLHEPTSAPRPDRARAADPPPAISPTTPS